MDEEDMRGRLVDEGELIQVQQQPAEIAVALEVQRIGEQPCRKSQASYVPYGELSLT